MRDRKTQWLAAAVIILVVGVIVGGVLLSDRSSRNASVDISLPDPSASSSLENSAWPIEDNLKGKLVELTRDNVRTVIKMLARPESYCFSAVSTVYYGEIERRVQTTQWLLPDRTATRRMDEKLGTCTLLIRRDGSVTTWEEGSGTAYTCAEGQFDDDDLAGIPTYERVLDPDEVITRAEYRMYGDDLCIFVRTANGHDYSDYYVGVESGLLLHSETYSDNELIYGMTLTSWSEDVSEAENIVPPEQ